MQFSWTPPNATDEPIEHEKYPNRIKNAAIQICILDYSCRSFENMFIKDFKDELSYIANEYLMEKQEQSSLVYADSGLQFKAKLKFN